MSPADTPGTPGPLPEPELPPAPPDEAFWEKYNGRSEFALSSVGTVVFHVAFALLLYAMLGYLGPQTAEGGGVPMNFVDADGFDDTGRGSQSSGGSETPLANEGDPFKASFENLDTARLPDPLDTPKPKAQLTDPSQAAAPAPATSVFSSPDAAANSQPGTRAKSGNANDTGANQAGTGGKGPGGTGNDATQRRGEDRFSLNIGFSSEGNPRAKGRAFLDELGALGGTVVVYKPAADGSPRQCFVYPDISRSTAYQVMSESEVNRQFRDRPAFAKDPKMYERERDARGAREARAANEEVALALGLEFFPDKLVARFPPGFRQTLLDKEATFLARVRAETPFNSITPRDVARTAIAVDREARGDKVIVAGIRLNDDTEIMVGRGGQLRVGRRR